MATPKAIEALVKTKEAVAGIKRRLHPVLERLHDDTLDDPTRAHAQATVALSIGMMKYMGARLRGLDQGRHPEDPLRQQLNNMRRVLAAVQKKHESRKALVATATTVQTTTTSPEIPSNSVVSKQGATPKSRSTASKLSVESTTATSNAAKVSRDEDDSRTRRNKKRRTS
jgi:hypothetical protein